MRYEIEYVTANGAPGTAAYSGCKDAGTAFAKCQKDNPGARMVRARAFSGVPPYVGEMWHDYPPVQRDPKPEPRPARAPKPDELDGVMPFYDSVRRRKGDLKLYGYE